MPEELPELPEFDVEDPFLEETGEGAYPVDSSHHDAAAVLVAALDMVAGDSLDVEAATANEALQMVESAQVDTHALLVAWEQQVRTMARWLDRLGHPVDPGALLASAPIPVISELQAPILAMASVLRSRTPRALDTIEPALLRAAAVISLWSLAAQLGKATGTGLRTVADGLPGYGEYPEHLPEQLVGSLDTIHHQVAAQLTTYVADSPGLFPLVGAWVAWRRSVGATHELCPVMPPLGDMDMRTTDELELWQLWPAVEAVLAVDSEVAAVASWKLAASSRTGRVTQVLLRGSYAGLPVTAAAALHTDDAGEVTEVAPGDTLLVVHGRTAHVLSIPQEHDPARPYALVIDALHRLKQAAGPTVEDFVRADRDATAG